MLYTSNEKPEYIAETFDSLIRKPLMTALFYVTLVGVKFDSLYT